MGTSYSGSYRGVLGVGPGRRSLLRCAGGLALVALCAAYLLPGLFGRDAWRNADVTAFATMLGIAEGRTPWWAPTLGDLAPETALLPHWLGAIRLCKSPGSGEATSNGFRTVQPKP